VLVLLVLQTTVITLLARESRIPVAGRPMYLGAAAVLVSECIKLPVCLAVISRQLGGPRQMLADVRQRVVVGWRDTLAMGLPALLFGLQNMLFFVSVSNLSATSYQLWSQSKTLTTALFYVLYLGGALRRLQWLSLSLLCAGVGLVQASDSVSAAAGAVAASVALSAPTGNCPAASCRPSLSATVALTRSRTAATSCGCCSLRSRSFSSSPRDSACTSSSSCSLCRSSARRSF